MRKKDKKVVYYSDPLNDDFAGTNIKTKKVDKNFKYIHKNFFWRFFASITYFFVLHIVVFFEKFILGVKFKNKKALRKTKGGCFLYGNHTGFFDAYTPYVLSKYKTNKVLVNPDAVSIKGIRVLVQWLGAIPIASDMATTKNMVKAIEYYNKKGNNITIYPEAHIWPYYTGVRPFKNSSFLYPVKLNAPVFAFFTAYSKPTGLFKKIKKADITVYVSQPFYPDLTKPVKEAQQELRDKVYNYMVEMSKKYSNCEVIKYVYKENEKNSENNKNNN